MASTVVASLAAQRSRALSVAGHQAVAFARARASSGAGLSEGGLLGV